MNKKLLVSVMMATPVAAFAAQANWGAAGGVLSYKINAELDQDNWLPAFGEAKVQNGVVVCPVGIGDTNGSVTGLLIGKYSISVSGLKNAILFQDGKALVKRNNAGQPVDANGKVIDLSTEAGLKAAQPLSTSEFTANSTVNKCDFIVKRQVADAPYEVGALTMTMVGFNFNTVTSNLLGSISPLEGSLTSVNDADNRQQAKDLRDEKADLEDRISEVEATVQAIATASTAGNSAALYAAYNKQVLNLWNSDLAKANDEISKLIKGIKADIATYNKNVDVENGIYANIVANTAAFNAIKSFISQARTNLSNKEQAAQGQTGSGAAFQYAKSSISAAVTTATTAINNYESAANTAYADLTKKVTFATSESEANINALISNVDYTNAEADYNAYQAVWGKDGAAAQVTAEYNRVWVKITGDGTTGDTADGIGFNGTSNFLGNFTNVYNDLIGEWTAAIVAIYNGNDYADDGIYTVTKPENNNIAGYRNLVDLTATDNPFETRKADLQKVLADAQAIYSTQQTYFATASALLNSEKTALDSKTAVTKSEGFDQLTSANQKKVNDAIAAVQAAYDALKNYVVAQYQAHDLMGTNYDTLKGNLDAANTAYTTATSGIKPLLQTINNLQAAYNAVHPGAVQYGFWDTLFKPSYEALLAAIATYQTPVGGNLSDIDAGIVNFKNSYDNLVANFTVADRAINGYTEAGVQHTGIKAELEKLNAEVNATVLVPGAVFNTATEPYKCDGKTIKAMNDLLASYQADLTAAGKKQTTQECAAAAQKLAEKITADGLLATATKAVLDYASKLAAANQTRVNAVKTEVEAAATTYAGKPGMENFSANIKEPEGADGTKYDYAYINTQIAAAQTVAQYQNCDQMLVNLYNAYLGAFNQVEKVKNNIKAYDELLGIGTSTLPTSERVKTVNSITGLENILDGLTIAPATGYYQANKIGGQSTDAVGTNLLYPNNPVAGSLKAQYNAAVNAVTAAYNKCEAGVNRAQLEQNFQNVVAAKGNLQKDIVANNNAYLEEIAAAREVENTANSYRDAIETKYDNITQAVIDKYTSQIDDVLTELSKDNVALTTFFGKGQSVANKNTFSQNFADYSAKLDQILYEATEGFSQAVIDHNNQFLKDQGVDVAALRAEYNYAVDAINKYHFDINNEGWENQIAALIGDHDMMQPEFDALNTLSEDVNKVLNKYNTNLHALTSDDVTVASGIPALLNDAAKIKTQITDKINEINDNCYAKVLRYYPTELSAANAVVTAVQSRLEAAGIKNGDTDTEKYLDFAMAGLKNPVNSAETNYTAYKNAVTAAAGDVNKLNEAYTKFIVGMSGICNSLDQVKNTVESVYISTACKTQWSEYEYAPAEKELESLREEMNGYTAATDYSTESSTLDNWIRYASNQNLYFESEIDPENWLSTYVNRLNGAVNAAKTIVANAKISDAANRADATVLNWYVNTKMPEFNNVIAALEAFCQNRPDQLQTIQGFKDDVSDLKDEMELNRATLKRDEETVWKPKVNALGSKINNGYKEIYTDEWDYACNDLLKTAREARNNAYVYNKIDKDAADSYDALIAQQAAALKAIDPVPAYPAVAPTVDAVKGWMPGLMNIESALCKLIAELQEDVKVGASETELNMLQDAYDEVTDAFTPVDDDIQYLVEQLNYAKENYNSKYEDYGKNLADKYQAQVDALSQKIAAVQESYEALYDSENGAILIAKADDYMHSIALIEAEYTEVWNAWTPERTQAINFYNSDKQYEKLTDQMSALMDIVDFAKGQADEYNPNTQLSEYSDLQDYSTLTLDALNRYKRSHTVVTNAPSLADALYNYWGISYNIVTQGNAYVRTALRSAAEKIQAAAAQAAQAEINDINTGIEPKYLDKDGLIRQLNNQKAEIEAYPTNRISDKWTVPVFGEAYWNPNVNDAATAQKEYEDTVLPALEDLRNGIDAILDEADVQRYWMGDVTLDPDGLVNTLDVMTVVDWILNSHSLTPAALYDEIYGSNPVDYTGQRQALAADVNRDEKINIADVTGIVDIMLNGYSEDSATASMRKAPAASFTEGALSLDFVGEVDGANRYAVRVNNPMALVSGQFDIKLAAGSRVLDVVSTDRTANHEVMYSENSDGVRVVVFSNENLQFLDNDGAVAFIDVDGTASRLTEAVFADASARAYEFGGASTITDMIIDGAVKAKEMIYDAAGRMYNKLQRGINIIRKADGTATKEIRK